MRAVWPPLDSSLLVDTGNEWILNVLEGCREDVRDMIIMLVLAALVICDRI